MRTLPTLSVLLLGMLRVLSCYGCEWRANQIQCGSMGTRDRDMTAVSAGPAGVWAIEYDTGRVYYRGGTYGMQSEGSSGWIRVTGISEADKGGTGWHRAGWGKMHISAGSSGLWAVDKDSNVWHRVGTYGDKGLSERTWLKVPSRVDIGQAKHVFSGDGFVLVVSEAGRVWRRQGLSPDNPRGSAWMPVAEAMKQVDTYGCQVWALDSRRKVMRADV